MIDRMIPKLLVAFGLATLVCVFVFRDSIRESMPAVLQRTLSGGRDVSGASARPAPKVPAEKAHRGAKRIVTGEEISTRELASRDIPVLEVVVPMAPFPSRSDVRVGMSRSEIIARFGEPDASATWSDEGTLSEKFIYKRTERSSEILIRAGRVVAMRRAVPVR